MAKSPNTKSKNKKAKTPTRKTVAKNKNAFRNYAISDELEAGVSLTGAEIKSVREGGMTISDAYIRYDDNNNLFLFNANIRRYSQDTNEDYDPTRDRLILVHKKQADRLVTKAQKSSMTIVPVKAYIRKGKLKVEIALGKGLKNYDKKEKIKNRDLDRQLHSEKRRFVVD